MTIAIHMVDLNDSEKEELDNITDLTNQFFNNVKQVDVVGHSENMSIGTCNVLEDGLVRVSNTNNRDASVRVILSEEVGVSDRIPTEVVSPIGDDDHLVWLTNARGKKSITHHNASTDRCCTISLESFVLHLDVE